MKPTYLALALLLPAAALAQFPDAPGKAEMVKVCSGCHELERSAAMKQDRRLEQSMGFSGDPL